MEVVLGFREISAGAPRKILGSFPATLSSQRENFADAALRRLSNERVLGLKLGISCSLVFPQSMPIPYAKPYHCHTIKKGLLHKIRKIVIIFRFIVQFGYIFFILLANWKFSFFPSKMKVKIRKHNMGLVIFISEKKGNGEKIFCVIFAKYVKNASSFSNANLPFSFVFPRYFPLSISDLRKGKISQFLFLFIFPTPNK